MLGWEKGLLEKRWNISTHKTGTGSIVEAQILPVFFFYFQNLWCQCSSTK